MDINGVTCDVRSVDVSHTLTDSSVPNLDVLVPTAGNDQIGVFSDEFGAENTVRMTRKATTATLKSLSELASLFIIDTNLAILTSGKELETIWLVVTGHQTVARVVDFVQLTA